MAPREFSRYIEDIIANLIVVPAAMTPQPSGLQ
jgi:hypothetical protein